MQISVRSYLTAGTAAVVGASAIVLAPALPGRALASVDLPMPAIVDVTLTGITLPFADILGVLQTFGFGGAVPGIIGLLPADLINTFGTEFLNQALPLLVTASGDVVDFLGATITGLFIGPDSIPVRIGTAVGNLPAVVTTAVEALNAGDIPAALQTLVTGLTAVTDIGQAFTEATRMIQSFVTTTVNDLVGALPGLILSTVQTIIGNELQATFDAITIALTGLFGGLLPAAATPAAAAVVDERALTLRIADVAEQSAASAPVPRATVARRSDTVTAVSDAPAPDGQVRVQAQVETPDQALEVAEETVAPVTRPRPRPVPARVALPDSVATGSSSVTRPKSTPRSRAVATAPDVSSDAAPSAGEAGE